MLIHCHPFARNIYRLSSLNCARIYNESLANPNAYILNNPLAFVSVHPSEDHCTAPDWHWSLFLKKEDVLDSFFLYSLLLDAVERVTCLKLGGDGKNQRTRLDPVLRTRNKHTEGIGQEAYTHACDLCFFLFEDLNGNLCKLNVSNHCIGTYIPNSQTLVRSL